MRTDSESSILGEHGMTEESSRSASLRGRILELELRKAELELARASRPWWREAAYLTAVAAVLAVVIPGTAAINGWFRLRLDMRKHEHEIQLNYLDRATIATQSPENRESVSPAVRSIQKRPGYRSDLQPQEQDRQRHHGPGCYLDSKCRNWYSFHRCRLRSVPLCLARC